MDSHHLVRRYAVLVDDDIPGQVAHGDDLVGRLHAFLLKVIYPRVYLVIARPVERCGMYMHDKRLAGKLLGADPGKICQPVMGMDYIYLIPVLHGYCRPDHGIAGDLLHEVGAVFA